MGIPEDRVTVQPMGVDLKSRFTPDMRVKRDPNHLLFVGRLVEKKGTHHLLKALPYVLEKHPKVKLTIAGFGPEERALRTMASDLGLNDRVSFVGPVNQEHLPNLYRKAGLLVAPFTVAKSGDQEGLGLVSIEALGCNCPVLAGDVDAVRDILPYECLRTDPRNPQTLAKDISKILSYSKEDLKEVYKPLFQRTRARFDWTEVTARYARILDAIKK
jgi:glycosyltransferase involved in cell wall biosynthesis